MLNSKCNQDKFLEINKSLSLSLKTYIYTTALFILLHNSAQWKNEENNNYCNYSNQLAIQNSAQQAEQNV